MQTDEQHRQAQKNTDTHKKTQTEKNADKDTSRHAQTHKDTDKDIKALSIGYQLDA